VASTLNLFPNGAVGFVDRLDAALGRGAGVGRALGVTVGLGVGGGDGMGL
jgi:hypothetical protein